MEQCGQARPDPGSPTPRPNQPGIPRSTRPSLALPDRTPEYSEMAESLAGEEGLPRRLSTADLVIKAEAPAGSFSDGASAVLTEV